MTADCPSDGQIAACRAIVRAVADAVPGLHSSYDLGERQLAAAALARSNRCLEAMLALLDADLPDAAGTFVRPIFELWLVGLYLLYDADTAWQLLAANHVHWVRRFPAEHFDALRRDLDGWQGTARPINWQRFATEVFALLASHGHAADASQGQSMYDIVYRGASMQDVHGAYQSVSGHIVDEDGTLNLVRVRVESGDPRTGLILTAGLVGMLGTHVLAAFGVPNDYLVSLADGLDWPETV